MADNHVEGISPATPIANTLSREEIYPNPQFAEAFTRLVRRLEAAEKRIEELEENGS